ncbi:hypothetical protein LSH36_136g05033 [Paralvinella palmiformis]|uniref:Neurotransmitter-gated ion-channel ligand-binding domain-containing protein n=1 Tax=Paralvinella palmiformis TaxID=53620 RepID=A0AAD9JXJ4_9ANNE|nr:hypothetical protein LSH36_136g05033 [Paralvinella palmiformis]
MARSSAHARLGLGLLLVASLLCPASANHNAKRLYEMLFRKKGYNRIVRPVMNESDRISVKIGLKLSQLIDVVSRPGH